MRFFPPCEPSITWSWRWAGPLLMFVTFLFVIATDICQTVVVMYGDQTAEWGLHISFPYPPVVSFVIARGNQSVVIMWPTYWSALSWALLVGYTLDILIMLVHSLKYKNICFAVFLLVSSLILTIFNIVLRSVMAAALLNLCGDVPCQSCHSGEDLLFSDWLANYFSSD